MLPADSELSLTRTVSGRPMGASYNLNVSVVSDYLSGKIRRDGSISFSEFMRAALYHPGHGYYTKPGREVFGRDGDFFTAAQVQPLFGILIARIAAPYGGVFVDWGAGRAEMRLHFADYIAVEAQDVLPERFEGFVLANELFDALPVDVYSDGVERRVTVDGGRFAWDGPVKAPVREVAPGLAAMIDEIGSKLQRGALLVLDYGYTERELARFPMGTLMSYRRHWASADVLDSPGERDITAHVNFDALRAAARAAGFRERRFTTMQQILLDAAEGLDEETLLAHRLQWKTLLVGMGEEFRALLLEKG